MNKVYHPTTDIIGGVKFQFEGKTYKAELRTPIKGKFLACEVNESDLPIGEKIVFEQKELW